MIAPLFDLKIYAKRRQSLLSGLRAGSDLVVFFTAPSRYRNHDSSYRFRPDSSFLYLSAFAEPEAAFLLWQDRKTKRPKFELFTLPRDPAGEQWDGYRWGPIRAAKAFGADGAFPIDLLQKRIDRWLNEEVAKGVAPRIFSNAQSYPEHLYELRRWVDAYRPNRRSGNLPIESLMNIQQDVGRLRLFKDLEEKKVLQKAADINVSAFQKLFRECKSLKWEYEAQSIIEAEYMRQGCQDPAYSSICASGGNATILHYVENNQRIRKGELLLVDAGCEYNFYASDITRTIPASGKFSPEQRAIYDVVCDALEESTRAAQCGTVFSKIHETSQNVLAEGLIRLKILKGKKADVIRNGRLSRYFPHGTGHWLGLDVHDESPMTDEKAAPYKLKSGMCFTVEPGIYFLPNDKSVDAKWRGIGIRVEDDLIMEKKNARVLTEKLPRRASEIEKMIS